MGCCPVAAFGVAYPQAVLSMILFWPVGGAKYRISSHQRFAEHLAFVQQHGLEAVVALVAKDGKPFGADPRGGPWASVIKADPAFARRPMRGRTSTSTSSSSPAWRAPLFDRDTAPGAEPEDLLAPRHPGADRARPRRRARDLGGALSRRMPAARGILGRAGRRADGGDDAGAGDGVFGQSERLGQVALDRKGYARLHKS